VNEHDRFGNRINIYNFWYAPAICLCRVWAVLHRLLLLESQYFGFIHFYSPSPVHQTTPAPASAAIA
jgi:hypothetical protein